jgi:hypothetical protein
MPYFDRMNERTNGLLQAFHSSSLHLTWTTALNVVSPPHEKTELCLDLEICVSLARLGLAQAQNTSKCSLWAVLFGSKRVSCTCNHTECTTSVNSIVRVHSSKICTFF